MADIIDITKNKKFKARKFEQLIEKKLHHSDPVVLHIWQKMAKDCIKKYPGVPDPGIFNIDIPQQPTQQDLDEMAEYIQGYLQEYISKVKSVMLSMLGDMIVLQKGAAEKIVAEFTSQNVT
ncbi:MAG: hypothetical protein OXD32_00535 [Endozoicomonadaceae bacterium]|nr:hypothetical protein [Endozoicomonadaceae bacterium]MCY4329633.1 hypothetical protein [Endozoicomonadaceae bacterium]